MLKFNGNNLYVILGFSCNGLCKHCSQKERLIIDDFKKNCVSEVFWDFLISWLREKSGNVFFYGGESLLYFNQIVSIVSRINEYKLRENVNFYIFTNGLNLNENMVEFINDNNICVILSFDGPDENFLRLRVPDKNALECWAAIHNKRINAVISKGNPNIVKSVLYLKNKFSVDLFSIGFNLLRIHWDMPKYLYNFSIAEINRMIDDVIRYENLNNLVLDHWLHKCLRRYFNKESEMFSDFVCTSCKNGYDTLSVDISGNIYACHNVKYILGSLVDDLENVNLVRSNLLRRFIPASCFVCSYRNICQCICPFALKNSKGTEFVHCKYFKLIYERILYNKDKVREL